MLTARIKSENVINTYQGFLKLQGGMHVILIPLIISNKNILLAPNPYLRFHLKEHNHVKRAIYCTASFPHSKQLQSKDKTKSHTVIGRKSMQFEE